MSMPTDEAGHGAVRLGERRRPRHRRRVYRRPMNWGRLAVGALLLTGLGVGGWRVLAPHTSHYALVVGGRTVTTVATRTLADQAIWALKRKHAPAAPGAVHFLEGPPQLRTRRGWSRPASSATAAEALDRSLTAEFQGVAIVVDGRPLVALGSREQAVETISRMLARGRHAPGVPAFRQRVVVEAYRHREGTTSPVPILTPARAAAFLVHPPRRQVHIIKRGESFWTVATAHQLSVQEIRALNPTLDPQALQPGDRVKLPDLPSPVTVITRQLP
jgi:hypothetical protein